MYTRDISLMVVNVTDATMLPPTCSPVERLASTDWDFPARVAHSGIEGIHPYPAKFVTELPRALLDILPVPSDTAVLDPFCGSGTTLVECQRRGIPCIGIDLNPIACLITEVKTSLRPSGLEEAAHVAVDLAQRARSTVVSEIPKLDHWFTNHVQVALASLHDAISSAHPIHQHALRLAFSSIVVRVSNQESDTRYAAVEKDVTTADVFSAFLRATNRISNALDERDYPITSATVFESDTLSFDSSRFNRQIGMVITSPPLSKCL